MRTIITHVSQRLLERQQQLAVAESCTGGYLSKICTDLPGSSQWFDRAYITYSNQAKTDMLGVPAETIDQHGAVSQQTVIAMAEGVLKHCPAHWSIAISGVAGPGGGSDINPIGSVWFAWGQRGGKVSTHKQQFLGDRDQIRVQSVELALEELKQLITV
jgi:nicotinamide-nucleotide amidase